MSFFRRPIRDVMLIEWFIFAAILDILWLAALPLLLSHWLALPRSAFLVIAYAVGIVFRCFAYDHIGGRKIMPASRSVRVASGAYGPLRAGLDHAFAYSDCWVDNMPTCAIDTLKLDLKDCSEFEWDSGVNAELCYPRSY